MLCFMSALSGWLVIIRKVLLKWFWKWIGNKPLVYSLRNWIMQGKCWLPFPLRCYFQLKLPACVINSSGINIRKQNGVCQVVSVSREYGLSSRYIVAAAHCFRQPYVPRWKQCSFSCTKLICRIQILTSLHLNLVAISCVNILHLLSYSAYFSIWLWLEMLVLRWNIKKWNGDFMEKWDRIRNLKPLLQLCSWKPACSIHTCLNYSLPQDELFYIDI